jgi:NADPH-dependent 2,4-dienoyl-CoA reductase/sulfur reductase-like enzyme/nitrite reductase/ring-hydroxylating ferredoxin subunit
LRIKRVAVAKVGDLEDGGMKAVEAGDTQVLLTRARGEFHAVGASCSHYGAPLEMGVVEGDRIYCPWHHACFNAKNGELVEPPALEGLPSYRVEIDGDDVVVLLPEDGKARRPAHRSDRAPRPDEEARTFVIVGGGAAGNAAARELRWQNFGGHVVLVTDDEYPPYDRPVLSKGYLQGKVARPSLALGNDESFSSLHLGLRVGQRAVSVDPTSGRVGLDSGENIAADRVLIATGGSARRLEVEGADLDGVFTLRSLRDADAIVAAAERAKRVAIVGSGFIGMEAAFSLRERGLDVTVVTADTVPFEAALGREVGSLFHRLHEEAGVRFEFEARVAGFNGKGSVGGLTLGDGRQVPADLVLVGVGIAPNTGGIAGIPTREDGSVPVDTYLCAVPARVYAAGDVASFPYWVTGRRIRIEHWRTAEQQGRVAARNMMGLEEPYRPVPFFWTTQAGLHFRYVGHAAKWDKIIVDGDIQAKDFLAYYIKDRRVLAVAGNGRDEEMARIEARMQTGDVEVPHRR